MPEIKFSHQYPKLYAQTAATLLSVDVMPIKELCPEFIEYDASYGNGQHYPLKSGTALVLTFSGNKMIPFTTVRPYGSGKWIWYKSLIGQDFKVIVDEPQPPEPLPLFEEKQNE